MDGGRERRKEGEVHRQTMQPLFREHVFIY